MPFVFDFRVGSGEVDLEVESVCLVGGSALLDGTGWAPSRDSTLVTPVVSTAREGGASLLGEVFGVVVALEALK